MTTKQWTAYVEADCILGSIPGDTEADAREYIEQYIHTGDLGPVEIRHVEQENE